MDYRRMYDDKEHLYAYDLDGREVTVQIERVFAGELIGEKGRKSKKPMIKFAGKDKKLAVNKTNGKTIASLYGKDTEQWVGKWITIYPTTTEFGGETVDCIRVRPQIPQPRGQARGGRNGNAGGGRREPPREPRLDPQPDLADRIAAEMGRQASAPADDAAETPCEECGVAPCACPNEPEAPDAS